MGNARKRLGSLVPATTDAWEILYDAPAGTEATAKVIVTNRDAGTPAVTIAVMTGPGDPTDSDIIENAFTLPASTAGATYFPWVLTLSAGFKIKVKASDVDVTFSAWGMEHT